MKIEQFSEQYNLVDLTEIQKVEHLSYFLSEAKEEPEFSAKDISELIASLGFAKPNVSRLTGKIKASSSFIKGSRATSFKLSAKRRAQLKTEIPNLSESEEIQSDDSVIPEILLKETRRPYLYKLSQQINACYEQHLYDACALMMRRLLEVLLIHVFENAGIEDDIKDPDGNFQKLKILINKAGSRSEISISTSLAREMDKFRDLGNLSAHRVRYNCRRGDIRTDKVTYRAIIEELLYEAGLAQR